MLILSDPKGNESCNLIGSEYDPDFSTHAHSHGKVQLLCVNKKNDCKTDLREREREEKNKFLTGLGLVHIMKNCDLGLANAARF